MANTNFLPEDYVEKRSQRRTNLISLSLFIVVMSGIIAAFLVTDRHRVEVTQLRHQVNTQFEEAAKRLDQLEQLQAQKQEMVRKAKVTAMLIERLPRSLMLAELINSMPSTLSLLQLDLETKVIRVKSSLATTSLDRAKQLNAKNESSEPQIRPTESTLFLVGVAPTDVQVAQYMMSLSRSPMFKDVNLVFSEEVKMSQDQLMRKFRIDMMLNPDVDIKKIEPKVVDRELTQDPMSNTIQINANGQLVKPKQPVGGVPAGDRPYKPHTR